MESTIMKVGPSGGPSYRDVWDGDVWDDKGKTEITQIFVQHGVQVNSIQMAYVVDGQWLLADKCGGNGNHFDAVTFDYPHECLLWVSGYYGSLYTDEKVVNSLTFGTNQGTYGPFGQEEGISFSFRMGKEHAFGGFHGYSSSEYLHSIGVYVKPRIPEFLV